MNSAKFPECFFFFARLSHYKSPIPWLNHLINFFSYVQLAVLSLVPIVIEYNQNHNYQDTKVAVTIFLSFFPSRETIVSVSFYTLVTFLLTCVYVLSIMIIYSCYYKQITVPKIILQLRGFLFLYHPTVIFISVTYSTVIQLKYFTDVGSLSAHNIFNLVIGLINIIILVVFQHWITPLLFSAPFSGLHGLLSSTGVVPSCAILYQKYVISAICIVFSVFSFDNLLYTFCITTFVLGTKNLIFIIKHPYVSNFMTSCEIGLFLSLAVAPVIIIILINYKVREIYCWIPTTTCFLFGTLFSYLWYMKKDAKYLSEISEDDNFDKYETENIEHLTNFVISHKLVSEGFHKLIVKHNKTHVFDVKFALIEILCCFVLKKDLEDKVNILNHVSSFTRSEDFIIFLFTKYQATYLLGGREPPEAYDLKKDITQYMVMCNDFWNSRMSGQILPCMKEVNSMHHFIQNLKLKFIRCKQFYPSSLDVEEIENKFMWRISYNDEYSALPTDLLSERVHKLLPTQMPLALIIIIVFMFISFLITCFLSHSGNFRLISDSQKLILVSEGANSTLSIGTLWVQIFMAFNSLINCTEYHNLTREDFFELIQSTKEPPSINLILTSSYVRGILSLFDELITSFRTTLAKEVANLSIWINPSITFLETQLSIIHVMFYYILNAQELFENETTCSSKMVEFMRNRSFTFSNHSHQLLSRIINSLDSTQKAIDDINLNDSFNLFVLIPYFATLALSLIFKVYQVYYCYRIVKINFKTGQHPNNPDIKVEAKDEPFSFHFSYFFELIVTIIFFFVFFGQYFIFQAYFHYFRDLIYDASTMLVQTEQISLFSSTSLMSLITYWTFHDGNVEVNSWITFYLSALNFSKLISKLDRNYHNEDVRRYITDYEDMVHPRSIHDIYAKWALTKQISLLFFYLPTMEHVDIKSHIYVEVQHIFITHLIPDYMRLASEFSFMAKHSSDDLANLLLYEFIVIIILFIFFTIFIISSAIKFKQILEQFNYIISLLDPYYIGSNQCMMNFLLGSQKNQTEGQDKYVFLRFLNEINIPLIVMTSKFSIIGFTRAIKIMFNYREEQLIGQLLSLLIPKNEKSYRFYNNVKNGESNLTQFATGFTSDGESILLEVTVTKLRVNNDSFYMMEMKSLQDLEYYEEYTQAHKELFDEIMSAEIPIFALKDTTKSLRYVICYASFEQEQNMFIISDVSQYKRGLEMSMGIYREAIVLYNSCSSILVLFVEADSSAQPNCSFIENAYHFLVEYGKIETDKIGLLIEGNDLCTLFFPLPVIENEAEVGGISVEKAKDFTPRPIVEGSSTLLAYLPQLITAAERNSVIISEAFLPFFQNDMSPIKNSDIIPGENLYSYPMPR